MGMVGVLMAFEDDTFRTVDLEDFLEEAPSCVAVVDVDKAWHALSVIAGEDSVRADGQPDGLNPPLGGTEFGEDNGYGAPRYLTPEQVKVIDERLKALSDEHARERFDPVAFAAANIYPAIWDEPRDTLWSKFLQPNLDRVRRFYSDATTAGHHVVLEVQ